MKFLEYCQGLLAYNDGEHVYEDTLSISCTCKMLSEVGILCSHCLHVFNTLCVQSIPDKYILKRWTKDIDVSGGSSGVGDARKCSKNDMVGSSVWRRGMVRKFSNLISASELNMNAWECIEEGFIMMKDKIITEVGPYFVDNSENEGRSSDIKDPVGRRSEGVHNVRKKSIVKINCNQVRGKRKSTLTHPSRIKTDVQLSMTNEDLRKDLNAPSSECQLSLEIYNSSDPKPSSILEKFINFM
ncbi:hypothetical protein M9H77_08123 [Catharanthus roseus]|uniref:Uncharacterized protein n=1 Tax=Catharanthus roseus TaxID=4058 RepID=A0ACC0BXA0_CATRO|nr:hypothetical protein M9H77_08123 [Catharanthus roseus]